MRAWISAETSDPPTAMTQLKFAKLVVAINAGVPLALLCWDALHGNLGADPGHFALLTTGMLAIVFLSLSLAVTPVRKLTGWNSLLTFRRTLGLYAFFYASLHFLCFYAFDQGWSFSQTVSEIIHRWYLAVGIGALLLMLPLALTSTNGMVRRLGARRWQALHRLAYVAVLAGVVHFYVQAKSDKRMPIAFAAAVGLMLGYRLVVWLGFPRDRRDAAAVVAPAASRKFWSGQLRVTQTLDETPSVRTFRLAAADGGALPFDYHPGQYLNLALSIDGRRVNRSYTIASSPSRPGHCELTIKREDNGTASRHMHEQIRVGDVLNVSAPAGHFTFTGAEADSIVLIGGGVGITPLMSVIRYLTDRDWPGEIYFVYCAKTEKDVIFRRELGDLARRFPNLHLAITLSRAQGDAWQGLRGRITPEMLAMAVPELARRIVHVCGPAEMMTPVKVMLAGLGVAEDRIKSEAFEYPKQTSPAGEVAEPEDMGTAEEGAPAVTFSHSGQTSAPSNGQTVLELSEALGIDIPFECRSGICGTCKTRLLSGRVHMDVRDALTKADHANQLILACQAKPLGPVVVDA